ncbi:sigma-54-dependent Fis family transcriptional regulator [candidate division KSB1 bacterium]|nr:sigma-54-dependent Fis family transcriptional regulator [candidate division KSB1 bacterium]
MEENKKNASILIIDDNPSVREMMEEIIRQEGYYVYGADKATEGLILLRNRSFDLVILDYVLPERSGMDVLKEIKHLNPEQLVIMISGYGSIEHAVRATKSGAYDFLEKPLEPERMLLTIRNALEKTSLIREKRALLKETQNQYRMIGVSTAMQRVFAMIDRVAKSNMRVLITGESGTGKELVARAIHFNSNRVSGPFHSLNCAAIPEELIESELFGHVRGAFTNAIANKKGAFLMADTGTLLLDEIGDLSLRAQAKVLRVIELGEVTLVGGDSVEQVDVRVIAATHRNLEEMYATGEFREDLFHRINVMTIHIPPLRERPEDIAHLAEHFLNESCVAGKVHPKEFSLDALALLRSQKWPGNSRELRNVVDRAMILAEGDIITGQTILAAIHITDLKVEPYAINDFRLARENFEKIFLINKLAANDWNVSKTALMIGLERTHLYRKMKRYKISEQAYRGK